MSELAFANHVVYPANFDSLEEQNNEIDLSSAGSKEVP